MTTPRLSLCFLQEIEDLEFRQYAFVDESIFNEIQKIDYETLVPSNEIVSITFTFFDSNKVEFDDLCSEVELNNKDDIHLIPKECFNSFGEISAKIQEKYNIKSYGLTVVKIYELAAEAIGVDLKNKV